MRKNQPVVMHIQPTPGADEHGYGQLVKLLREKACVSHSVPAKSRPLTLFDSMLLRIGRFQERASHRRTFLSCHSRRASLVQHSRPLEYPRSRNLECSWIPRGARQSSTAYHLIYGTYLSLNSLKRCRSICAVSSSCNREEGVFHYLMLLSYLSSSSSSSNSSNNNNNNSSSRSSSSSNGSNLHLLSNSSSQRTTSFKILGLVCRLLAPYSGIWDPSKGNSIRLCLEARRMRSQVGCWPSHRRRSNSNSSDSINNNRLTLNSSNIKHSRISVL